MATNTTGMRVDDSMVNGSVGKREHGHKPHNFAYGLMAAVFALALIGGVAIHDRRVSHPAAQSGARTITLLGGTAMNTRPVDKNEQQKFLEVNTTMPDPGAASQVLSNEQQKFLEVNTIMPVPVPSSYMEEITPSPGQPR